MIAPDDAPRASRKAGWPMSTRWKLLFAPSERAAEVIGLLLIGIGFAIDALTGPNYSNLLFYIPPLTYVAWFSGSRVGWVYVSLVAVIIVVVHLLESGDIQNIRAADYDAFTRIVTTAFVYWTVQKLRRNIVALRHANAGLERLNDQKNLLFGVIAHDLKSPFNAILGYAELLERSSDRLSTARVKEYAGSLGEAARRAFDLLANLLQWAQLQMERAALQPGHVEVQLLVERAAEAQRAAAALKGIEIVAAPAPAGLRVYVDFAAAQAVLRNLLGNAVKFTLPGGRVAIAARAVAGMAEISVDDTGVGIPESRLAMLFQIAPNRSTAGTAGETGLGLGLILCHDLVARSGGRLAAESRLGRGSRFTVALPRDPPDDPSTLLELPTRSAPMELLPHAVGEVRVGVSHPADPLTQRETGQG
jgi:signal transduction histidine kinase